MRTSAESASTADTESPAWANQLLSRLIVVVVVVVAAAAAAAAVVVEREMGYARRLHSRGIGLDRGSSMRRIAIDLVDILLPSGWLETGYMNVPSSRPAELQPKRKAELNPKGRHKLDRRGVSSLAVHSAPRLRQKLGRIQTKHDL